MLVVYKYDIQPDTSVPMAKAIRSYAYAKILKAAIDPKDNRLKVWMLVDTSENDDIFYLFRVIATGQEIPINQDHLRYISTIIEEDGFVWHIFLEI